MAFPISDQSPNYKVTHRLSLQPELVLFELLVIAGHDLVMAASPEEILVNLVKGLVFDVAVVVAPDSVHYAFRMVTRFFSLFALVHVL